MLLVVVPTDPTIQINNTTGHQYYNNDNQYYGNNQGWQGQQQHNYETDDFDNLEVDERFILILI